MPIKIKAKELASIFDLSLEKKQSELSLFGVQTDSREVEDGNIFFARKGEASDGHKYLEQAVKAGAKALVVDEKSVADNQFILSSQENAAFCLIPVSDVDKALLTLASYWREQIKTPVIAVTGSNGKTSTKEILRCILEESIGEGTANQKSYNNHVGVPLTILSAPLDTKWMVLEMGMNHSGELLELGKIAKPDLAIILNVGSAHMGHFSSLSEIADAKCELAASLKKGGILVTPDFDKEIDSALGRIDNAHFFQNHFKFGNSKSDSKESDLQVSNIKSQGFDGMSFEVSFSKSLSEEAGPLDCSIPLLGEHSVLNSAASLLAAKLSFKVLSIKKLVSSLKSAKPASMRLEVKKIKNITILNDSYNANPVSMSSALSFLSSVPSSKYIIFGEMAELGDKSKVFHFKLLNEALALKPKALICIWPNFKDLENDIKKADQETEVYFLEKAAATPKIIEKLKNNSSKDKIDTVLLLKGSRASQLEEVLEEIVKEIS